MPPVLLKSSRFSPQPHWKIATSMPYAAATERRLSRIALSAITIERNATRSSRNANSRTNPNTSGADDFIIALKSKDFAVEPPTAYSTPATVPIVAGTSSLRRVARAWFETSSAPLPASGIATSNVFPSSLVSTWIGFCISPEASALAFRSAIAALTCVGSPPVIATSAALAPPGNASSITWNAASSGWLFGNASSPLSAVCRCNAGSASTRSSAVDATVAITGWRRTGLRIAPQKRLPSPLSFRSRCRNGILPFSTLSPSRERIAGSTVSEPIIATATTIIVPIANDMNVLSPESNMPAIAMITVKPEISTARPDVAAAASSAARSLRPARRSSRSRRR